MGTILTRFLNGYLNFWGQGGLTDKGIMKDKSVFKNAWAMMGKNPVVFMRG